MEIFKIMIISLFWTIIIEVGLALILKVRSKKDVLNIILVNILTNPVVTSLSFTINIVYGITYRRISMLILESLAVFIEGFIYHKYLNYQKINSYLLSLILNLASYLLGIVINLFIWG